MGLEVPVRIPEDAFIPEATFAPFPKIARLFRPVVRPGLPPDRSGHPGRVPGSCAILPGLIEKVSRRHLKLSALRCYNT